MSTRALVLWLWRQRTDEQLLELGTVGELRAQYLPPLEVNKSLAAQFLREDASQEREQLRTAGDPWIVSAIPTLRWRQERVLALLLDVNLTRLDNDQALLLEPNSLSLRWYNDYTAQVIYWKQRLEELNATP